MSLWWLWGGGTATAGDSEENAPSLWSGGVAWGTAIASRRGYWQSGAVATERTGTPHLSIAVAGVWLNNDIRQASWDLGRSGWFDPLQASAASLEFEGEVDASVMDSVVIGVMSDVTNQHSDPLWVGYVDTINTTTEPSGRVTTSVSCIDWAGRLGQSPTADEFPIVLFPNGGIGPTIEAVAEQAGTILVVEDDSVFASEDPTATDFEDGETVLGFINRVETEDNLNVFSRGDGKLVIQRRWYVSAPDLDPAPTPVAITPLVHVKDAFDRTETDSWGDADKGGTWSPSSDADLDVADGWGTLVSNGQFIELPITHTDVAADLRCKLSALPSTGSAALRWVLRTDVDFDPCYSFGVSIASTGVVSALIIENPGATTIASATATHVGTYAAGEVLRLRASAVGSVLSVWVWRDGEQMPRTATASVTDASIASGTYLGVITTNATDTPTWSVKDLLVLDLDDYDEANAPVSWTVQMSPTTVVNDWGENYPDTTTTQEASQETYGLRSFSPPLETTEWTLLIDTDLLLEPRPLLTDATFAITDLGQAALFLDPNDWVTVGGDTYQVLSVRHTVTPGLNHDWRMSITGDSTQPLLHEEF